MTNVNNDYPFKNENDSDSHFINSSNLFAFQTNDLARIFAFDKNGATDKKEYNDEEQPPEEIQPQTAWNQMKSRLVQLEDSLEDSGSDIEFNLPELGDIDIGIENNNNQQKKIEYFWPRETHEMNPSQFSMENNNMMNAMNHGMVFNPFNAHGAVPNFSPFMEYQKQTFTNDVIAMVPQMTQVPSHHRSVSIDSAFLSKQQTSVMQPVFSDDTNIKFDEYSTPLCRYFAAGYCNRGDRCNFSHDNTRDDKKDMREKFGKVPKKAPQKDIVDATAKYTSIEEVVGQIYKLCKDQHGCRFLQKQLEEGNANVVKIVFSEVYDYIVELMTDPFGNYLCQKLIEFCDKHQQLLIVQKVSQHLVTISKNMHGTRAVQKMIECLVTPNQVQLVVNSLKSSVVTLIQDLNGNHVIQRCLYRLSTNDKQFVYDAVASNCVEVATHRHGCCVMQRCIDYASDDQKLQLVREIANNVLSLVQDPFGNYVVQYVLDLPFMIVRVQLISQFLGHLSYLSTQKFSSNVIEKCLRVATEEVKYELIEELMQKQVLPHLLQDPFGNYVIQTALGYAISQQKVRLVEAIRPHLPNLRNAPYGKRIQNKITKDN